MCRTTRAPARGMRITGAAKPLPSCHMARSEGRGMRRGNGATRDNHRSPRSGFAVLMIGVLHSAAPIGGLRSSATLHSPGSASLHQGLHSFAPYGGRPTPRPRTAGRRSVDYLTGPDRADRLLARRTCFPSAPIGAKECSHGREPVVCVPLAPQSPRGATEPSRQRGSS